MRFLPLLALSMVGYSQNAQTGAATVQGTCNAVNTGNASLVNQTCYNIDKKFADQIAQLVNLSKRSDKTLTDILTKLQELIKGMENPTVLTQQGNVGQGNANVTGNNNTVTVGVPAGNAAAKVIVAALLNDGTSLMTECDSLEEKKELVERASKWANAAFAKLRAIDVAYAAQFQASSGFPTYSRSIGNQPVPVVNQNVWNYLNAKTQILARILDRL
jgi:hypothetical protein